MSQGRGRKGLPDLVDLNSDRGRVQTLYQIWYRVPSVASKREEILAVKAKDSQKRKPISVVSDLIQQNSARTRHHRIRFERR